MGFLESIAWTVAGCVVVSILLAKSQRFRNVCIPLIVLIAGTVWYLYRKAVERACIWLQKRAGTYKEPQGVGAGKGAAPATASLSPTGASAGLKASSVPPQRQARVKVKWMNDEDAPNCLHCNVKFTLLVRRHHCRVCQKIFCNKCSSDRIAGKRACIECMTIFKTGSAPSKAASPSDKSKGDSQASMGPARVRQLSPGMQSKVSAIKTAEALRKWYEEEMARVTAFLDDDKLFKAAELSDQMVVFLGSASEHKELKSALPPLLRQHEESAQYRRIHLEVRQSNELLFQLTSNEGWDTVKKTDTVHTLYRQEPGKETHSFKVIGEVEAPVFQLTAVIMELDLYPTWFPFMKMAVELKTVSRFRKIAQLNVGMWPLADREMLVEGYGVDFSENNQVIVNVRSIDSSPHMVIPPPAKGAVRAIMHFGGFLMEPLKPNRCRLSFMVNVDPKMAIPYWMLNGLASQLVHMILSRMRKASQFDAKSEYAKRIQRNAKVYQYIHELSEEWFLKRGYSAEELRSGGFRMFAGASATGAGGAGAAGAGAGAGSAGAAGSAAPTTESKT